MKRYLSLFFLLSFTLQAQLKSIDDFTKDLTAKSGFFTTFYDEARGKLYLQIDQLDKEFLYYPSLAQGVGSNDIGLDRGRLGSEHVVKFEKHGNKIFLTEVNYKYRALSTDHEELKAVKESFAKSIHFGFEVQAVNGNNYLIDLSPFMLQDALGASEELSSMGEGNYKVESSRSGIYMPMTKNFPENSEFESIITLIGSKPGREVRSVTPTAEFITIHQHQSFVKLPEIPLPMRKHDPRIGYIGISFFDYASPISEPIEKQVISRHRLIKKNPRAKMSEPVEPIVYYMDPGAPEPIRSALMEGAAWWNQAFEAAGFKNAFQVKLLPADADPMDVRYNLIQWVHRSTRGWSYGSSIIDPRTGEILKGKVSLGSLRVRQDFLIAQGLIADFSAKDNRLGEVKEMALQRLRQLAAHEVGHTLGLPHNYIASTANRASVMDYPHPLANLENGKITLGNAYDQKIGAYDKVSIQYGYQYFENEKEDLDAFVTEAIKNGHRFLTDQDARPIGSENPYTHLWDNGASAAEELKRVCEIRKHVLNNFSENKISQGQSLATLEEVFVPMYMFHRYQLDAASKVIGGADYNFAKNGDGQLIYQPVGADMQKQALEAVLATLKPEFLAVPTQLIGKIPPRPFRERANSREVFESQTGLSFDPLAPAKAASNLTFSFVLNSSRCNRLSLQQSFDESLPSLTQVLDKMHYITWANKSIFSQEDYQSKISRVVAMNYLHHLMALSLNKNTSFETKGMVLKALSAIEETAKSSENSAFGMLTLNLFDRFEENPADFVKSDSFSIPNGQPIDQDYNWLELDCSFN